MTTVAESSTTDRTIGGLRGGQLVLSVRGLHVAFDAMSGMVPVVRGVDLDIYAGRTTALVGESGCGKSVTALSILRLLPSPPARIEAGRILLQSRRDMAGKDNSAFVPDERALAGKPPVAPGPVTRKKPDQSTIENRRSQIEDSRIESSRRLKPAAREVGVDLLQLTESEMRRVRGGRVAMIFQDPLTSLNPVMTIGHQIIEAIELHQPLKGREGRDKAVELLDRVGIPDAKHRVRDYPHQLSGGMRQRVIIAMALACEPDVLVADEPTTALDVTTQARILELLQSIQEESGMGLLLITHDLGVVAQVADEVYVMYSGRIVEHAATEALFASPLHPYTRGLMRCTPRLDSNLQRLEVIPGSVPDPSDPPSGCRFHPRCDLARDRAQGAGVETHELTDGLRVPLRCAKGETDGREIDPPLRPAREDHWVACWEAEA